jgi:hypothetical protein
MLEGKIPDNLKILIKKDKMIIPDLLTAFGEYKRMTLLVGGDEKVTCTDISDISKILSGESELSEIIPYNSFITKKVSRKRLRGMERKIQKYASKPN